MNELMSLTVQRQIEPEILDGLSADDPDAIASRRDLRRINFLMGNYRWIERELLGVVGEGDRIVELGAGDGALARRVAAKMPDWRGEYVGLDMVPEGAFFPKHPAFRWLQEDLMETCALEGATIVIANMVLHHFKDDALARLGGKLGSCRLLLAREPARRNQWMQYLLYPLGLNRVTRHDMRLSIEAGFLDGELPSALGLNGGDWQNRVHHTRRGAYELRAERTEVPGAGR